MPISTGEFLGCVLLAVTPTALGAASNDRPASVEEWLAALKRNDIGEDRAVLDQIMAMFQVLEGDDASSRLAALKRRVLRALLTPVVFREESVPVVFVLKELLWTLGTQEDLLNRAWSRPPHPGGRDALAMVATMEKFDEQSV